MAALAQTQSEINRDALQEYERADHQPNEIYRQVLLSHQKDDQFCQTLKKAQRFWIQYRDAQLNLKFPPRKEKSYYQSVLPMVQASLLTELTLQRTEELKELVNQRSAAIDRNRWSGRWYGGGKKESVLSILKNGDESFSLSFKGEFGEWEGFGYEKGNELITVFRYKDSDEKGYCTISRSDVSRAEFSSYNSDGSYRANGFLIKE
ncbi:MAG: lysozyme inhibitor LprI family protein [Bacteroidota bacterium]